MLKQSDTEPRRKKRRWVNSIDNLRKRGMTRKRKGVRNNIEGADTNTRWVTLKVARRFEGRV